MKKMKKRLALILMTALVFTSFSFIGAFAENGNSEAEPVVTEQTTDETLNMAEGEVAALVAPDVKAFASFQSVKLEWQEIPEAAVFNIYYGEKKANKLAKKGLAGTKTTYTVKNLDPFTTYKFRVDVYTGTAENPTELVKSEVVSKRPVRPITYKIRIKAGTTLKSHGTDKDYTGKKGSKSYTVRTGQWIEAQGYGAGGKYIIHRKGYIFYCNLTRAGAKEALYAKEFNYTPEEAEIFVNSKGVSSRTGYMVWVSTYTQHVFLFKGKKGSWKCVDDWECSTGRAGAPTPTGNTGMKSVWKKIPKRHNIPYWTCFSEINALHGKKSGWKMGKPASNGCVRNPIPKAKIIYEKVKKNARVYVY